MTKMFRILLVLILTVCASSVVCSAQYDKLPELAENASFEETQKWLAKEIKKFSKVYVENTFQSEYTRMSEFNFDGCKLKYRYTVTATSKQSRSASGLASFDYMTVVFLDLSEIDPETIAFRASKHKDMKTVVLNMFEGKNTISYKTDPNTRSEKTGIQNRAVFTIKADVAEPIKAGFARAVKFCRM